MQHSQNLRNTLIERLLKVFSVTYLLCLLSSRSSVVLLRSAVLCSTAIQVHGLRRLLWASTSRDSANAIRSPTRTNSTPVIQRTNRIDVPRFFGLPKCPCARQQLESQNSTSLDIADITLYEHKEHNKLQHPFLKGEGSNWKRQDWRNSGAISTLSLKALCGMSL